MQQQTWLPFPSLEVFFMEQSHEFDKKQTLQALSCVSSVGLSKASLLWKCYLSTSYEPRAGWGCRGNIKCDLVTCHLWLDGIRCWYKQSCPCRERAHLITQFLSPVLVSIIQRNGNNMERCKEMRYEASTHTIVEVEKSHNLPFAKRPRKASGILPVHPRTWE